MEVRNMTTNLTKKSSLFTGWRLMPFNGLMFWVSQQAADHWFQGALLDSWRSLRFAEVARRGGGGGGGWRGREEGKMKRRMRRTWALGGDEALWWDWRRGERAAQRRAESFWLERFQPGRRRRWQLSLLLWWLFPLCCCLMVWQRRPGSSPGKEQQGVDLENYFLVMPVMVNGHRHGDNVGPFFKSYMYKV